MGRIDSPPADEAHPTKPRTPYGKSKLEAEKQVRHHSTHHGLETTIIRPVITYGPGDDGFLIQLTKMIFHRRFAIIGNGRNRLHLCYIDDLIDGMILAALSPAAANETFIMAAEKPIMMNDLVAEILSALGSKHSPPCVPVWPLWLAGCLMEGLYSLAGLIRINLSNGKPLITRHRVQLLSWDRAYDIGKAERSLGFAPRIGYREGITRALHDHPFVDPT